MVIVLENQTGEGGLMEGGILLFNCMFFIWHSLQEIYINSVIKVREKQNKIHKE